MLVLLHTFLILSLLRARSCWTEMIVSELTCPGNLLRRFAPILSSPVTPWNNWYESERPRFNNFKPFPLHANVSPRISFALLRRGSALISVASGAQYSWAPLDLSASHCFQMLRYDARVRYSRMGTSCALTGCTGYVRNFQVCFKGGAKRLSTRVCSSALPDYEKIITSHLTSQGKGFPSKNLPSRWSRARAFPSSWLCNTYVPQVA